MKPATSSWLFWGASCRESKARKFILIALDTQMDAVTERIGLLGLGEPPGPGVKAGPEAADSGAAAAARPGRATAPQRNCMKSFTS